MKRLKAETEGELTRRVWNAMDRSEPTRWRRTVPECTPFAAGATVKEARKRPNLPMVLLFQCILRFLQDVTLRSVHVLIDWSPRALQIGRVGPRPAPKCAQDPPPQRPQPEPPERAFATIFLDHELSDRGFLLSPAVQL